MRDAFVAGAILAAMLTPYSEIDGLSMQTQTDDVRRTMTTMIAVVGLNGTAVIDSLRIVQRRDIDVRMLTYLRSRPIDVTGPRLGTNGHKHGE